MYSYYALKAFRVRIPRPISVTITTMQIMQMLIGLYVAVYIFGQKLSGQTCKMTMGESMFSFGIYTAYFVLFLNFFIQSYFFAKSSKPSDVLTEKASDKLNSKLATENDSTGKLFQDSTKISSSILNEQTCLLEAKKVQ